MQPIRRISLLIALAFLGHGASGLSAADRILIIANPEVPTQTMDAAELSRIFMLKRTVWPNGTAVVPVNREASSEARQRFSEEVLGRNMRSLATYWNQMQFKGFMPPVVQESDAAVAAFVRNVPGAIGYIVADAPPEGVRVLGEFR